MCDAEGRDDDVAAQSDQTQAGSSKIDTERGPREKCCPTAAAERGEVEHSRGGEV